MSDPKITIKLTKHATTKVAQRNISLEDIKRVILKPGLSEPDRFDKSLIHYIDNIGGKFLGVIGRWEDKEVFVVISAFYDRRLKRKL